MVSRLTSIFPLIFLTLLIFSGLEMVSGLAMKHLLFAAEPGHRDIVGRVAIEAQDAVPAAGNVAGYSIITKRNLFGLPPEGKPEEAAVTDPFAGLQATSLDLVLMGIVDGGSQDSRAVILCKKDKKQQIYQVGDMVSGAQIKSILWGKVVLSANGRNEVLDMRETARYRAGEVAATAPIASQDKIVASSEGGGDVASRLIPERVRLVLPDQAGSGAQNGE